MGCVQTVCLLLCSSHLIQLFQSELGCLKSDPHLHVTEAYWRFLTKFIHRQNSGLSSGSIADVVVFLGFFQKVCDYLKPIRLWAWYESFNKSKQGRLRPEIKPLITRKSLNTSLLPSIDFLQYPPAFSHFPVPKIY